MKICNNCHKELDDSAFNKDRSKKDGLSTQCRACRAEWKRVHKEYIAEYNRSYGSAHKKEAADRHKRNREAKPELYRAIDREWRKNNPDKVKKYAKVDYEKHKGQYKFRASIRSGVQRGSSVVGFTMETWNEILEYFGNACCYCGETNEIGMDHVIPANAGGEFRKGNIVPACKRCNGKKRNSDMEQWYRKQSFFDGDRLKKITDYIG